MVTHLLRDGGVSYNAPSMKSLRRIEALLEALGIDSDSFDRFLEWALCEHLVTVLARSEELGDAIFSRPDALKIFRTVMDARTGRRWSQHDLDAIFERVKSEKVAHYRSPIPYEEYLKLLWQVPLECARCQRRPPEVRLHIDHIVPASRGGKSLRANLQFLCADHNLQKSNKREVSERWLDLT